MITIDASRCQHCNRCHLVCPTQLIEPGPKVRAEAETVCLECGHCVAVCPEGAVSLNGFEGLETPAMTEASAVTPESLRSLLQSRRSARLYRTSRVSREHVERMLEAASFAPSSENLRPTRAYVITDDPVLEQVRDRTAWFYRRLLWLFGVPGFNWIWRLIGRPAHELERLRNASRQISSPEMTRHFDPILHRARTLLVLTVPRGQAQSVGDAWLAAWNAALCAETLGVSACFNGFVEVAANWDATLHALLGVPRDERVVNVMTLGYPSLRFARAAPRRQIRTSWIGPATPADRPEHQPSRPVA